jgi:hypothetical protein
MTGMSGAHCSAYKRRKARGQANTGPWDKQCSRLAFKPGNPTIIVENMPGAGHILATNYLFNLAPRDGTAIGTVSRNMTEAATRVCGQGRAIRGRHRWCLGRQAQ